MRDKFPGHYPLNSEEYERIWESATIVLDANILLNPYRYSVALRERFTQILTDVSSRLWIPHQAAWEFHDQRLGIIQGQHDLASELDSGFDRSFKQAKEKLHEYKKNALLDVDSLESKLDSFYESLKKEIMESHSQALDRYGLSVQDDSMLGKLAEILDGSVGSPYSEQDSEALRLEADERYKRKVPPGYKDSNKSGNRIYGDYIIWRQILDYAKSNKVDVLLVTDDAKEDWWWRASGTTLGPRPELREEFIAETSQIFYIYRSDKFIAEMSSRRKAPLGDGLLAEVRSASNRAGKQNLEVDLDSRERALLRRVRKVKVRSYEEEQERINEEIGVAEKNLNVIRSIDMDTHNMLMRKKDEVRGILISISDVEDELGQVRTLGRVANESSLIERRDRLRSGLQIAYDEQRALEERDARIGHEHVMVVEQVDMLRRQAIQYLAASNAFQDEIYDNGSRNVTGGNDSTS